MLFINRLRALLPVLLLAGVSTRTALEADGATTSMPGAVANREREHATTPGRRIAGGGSSASGDDEGGHHPRAAVAASAGGRDIDAENSTHEGGVRHEHRGRRPRRRRAAARIVGGGIAPRGRFPYQAAVFSVRDSEPSFECAGTLVAPDVVLCAAHCFLEKDGTPERADGDYFIQLGRHDLTDVTEVYENFGIERILTHPNYEPNNSKNNDFALVKLRGTSTFQTISLNGDKRHHADDELTVIGWGRTSSAQPKPRPTSSSGDTKAPHFLQEVVVEYVSNSACKKAYEAEDTVITRNMLCAAGAGRDSCQGDSGGPIVVMGTDASEDVQVGVVSFGEGCANPSFPGVYARVRTQYSWIQTNLCTLSQHFCGAAGDEQGAKNRQESSPATFVAPTSDVRIFTPIADTYVWSGNEGINNYGSDPVLVLKRAFWDRKIVIKFDLNQNVLPATTTATLRLHVDDVDSDPSRNITVFGLPESPPWEEMSVTWATLKATPGKSGANFIITPSDAQQWVEVDITGIIRDSSGSTLVLMMEISSERNSGSRCRFSSRESFGFAPELVVEPENLPSSTPSVTPTIELTSGSNAPSRAPSGLPIVEPENMLSSTPSFPPIAEPPVGSNVPSRAPSGLPSLEPENFPSSTPSFPPIIQLPLVSNVPSIAPSGLPIFGPPSLPSLQTNPLPSPMPSLLPTSPPTHVPSGNPSVLPLLSTSPIILSESLPKQFSNSQDEPTFYP